MSHNYNSFSKTQTYLGRKRMEPQHEMPKKRYDYPEEKYCRNDRYDNNHHSSNFKHNQMKMKDYSQDPIHYTHNSKSHSHDRDNWYNRNRNLQDKSPRRDFRKQHNKYSNDTEGVRNLSHCDMPSPPKKKIEENTRLQRDKTGIIEGLNLNSLMANIVPGPFPQNGPYQHIFQNQQNINIKINLTQGQPNSKKGKEKDLKDKETQFMKDETNIPIEEDEYTVPKALIQPPQPKGEIAPFDRSAIKIERNPFDVIKSLPIMEAIDVNDAFNQMSNNRLIQNEMNVPSLKLPSCYLLAKIPNRRLVTNFVPGAALAEEKYKRIPRKDIKGKFYLLYNDQIEQRVERIIEESQLQRNKYTNEFANIRRGIERCSSEADSIKLKLFTNEFNSKMESIRLDEINAAILENTKDD